MKKVSVIVTCYNKGKYILETLESITNQTYSDIETIIIDDCSTDNYTRKLLSELSAKNYKIILLEKNIGVAEARNTGIKNSNGEYILILDGDDKIAPEYIENAIKIIENDNQIKIVSCEVELFGYMKGKLPLAEPKIEYLIAQNALIISSLFKKTDYEKTSGFNPNMKEGLEDWDFWLSLLETGGKAFRIPKTLFYYRISKKSRNNLDFEKLRKLRRQIYENHKELYARYMLDPVDSFEYTLIKTSWEYRIGNILLKPIRFILKTVFTKK